MFSLYYMSRQCKDCWCVFTILHVEAVCQCEDCWCVFTILHVEAV